MRKDSHIYPAKRHLSPLWISLLIVSLLLFLTACGGTDTGTTATATSAPAATDTPTPTPTTAPTDTPTPPPTPTPVATTPSGPTVSITSGGGFAFSPKTLTVSVGTTVTWKNQTGTIHTVTSDDGKTFDSSDVSPGGTFSFKFTTAGTYAYHCNIHPSMTATIVVQ